MFLNNYLTYFVGQDSAEGHTSLHGIIAGTELPFPINPSNACTKGLTCPIVAGQSHIYSVSLHCPFFAPTVSICDSGAFFYHNHT